MFPRHINIRGLTYTIKQVDEISPKSVEDGKDDDIILGAFDYWKSTIELRRDVPEERKRICLIHELLHALAEGMKLPEDQVGELAWGLYDVLKRNHFFRKWL